MKIVPGTPDQLRCLRENDMLCGLISKIGERWRVELFMRVDAVTSSKEEAVAFAKGCWAMGEAYGLLVVKNDAV